MIEAKNLSFRYDREEALHTISLDMAEGEIVGILGPNASGKTTLLKNLAGLLTPTTGQVLVGGRPLSDYPQRELAQRIAFVPQGEEIFLPYTALEIVLMGRAPYLGIWGFEGDQDRQKVREAMEWTDVWGLRQRTFQELSGGERQRVILARAIAQGAPLLLLDEPTSHLDIRYQIEVLELCSRLNREKGATILVTLHDMHLASLFCHRLLLLKDGALFAAGRPQEVMTRENILQVFGVEVTPPYFLTRRKSDL